MEKEKSKITFKLEEGNGTAVSIMRNGKRIGRVWSENSDGTKPYPHNEDSYCLNSIQICGFDRISEIWACGPFTGKKDCVVHFIPNEEEYYKNKIKGYEKYVKSFFNTKVKEVDVLGKDKEHFGEIVSKENKPIMSLQSFDDWVRHNI